MSAPDAILRGEEAFARIAAIGDPFVHKLVHQAVVDVLGTRSLAEHDLPLDMLLYVRCMERVYSNRARVAALVHGAEASMDEGSLGEAIDGAERSGHVRRGGEVKALVRATAPGPVRALLLAGIGAGLQVIMEGEPATPPVDLSVFARLMKGSFEKTVLIGLLAEGREPEPFW